MPKTPNTPNAVQLNHLADHTPSQKMVVADTLSRSPLEFEAEPDTVEDVQAFVNLFESTRPATKNQLERIKGTSAVDTQLQKLVAVTSQGWATRVEEVPLQIREFIDARGHLSIGNGLLTYDDRIVIASDTGCHEKENTGKHSQRQPGRNKVLRTCQPVRMVAGYFQRD
ncbi:unnamed protein product [Pocillopora meandrina]|uniref:Uncharacterized protein n=1 Tax=Pocillopora meandrina TaxID=46732 RepID=A0AAU9VT29_9CNID|nr:unnamed protein product [Pocillopora meandrina]